MKIKRNLILWLSTIICIVIIGNSGYYFMVDGNPNFMNFLYMTVISLTSVGYGKILNLSGNTPARLFTMILITNEKES